MSAALEPSLALVVLVVSCRALKLHGGVGELFRVEAARRGRGVVVLVVSCRALKLHGGVGELFQMNVD